MSKLCVLTLISLLIATVAVGCSSSDQGAIDKVVSATLAVQQGVIETAVASGIETALADNVEPTATATPTATTQPATATPTVTAQPATVTPTATTTPELLPTDTPVPEPTTAPVPTPTPEPTATPEPDVSIIFDKLIELSVQATAERHIWEDKVPKDWNAKVVNQNSKESLDGFRIIKIAVIGMEPPSQCEQLRDVVLEEIELYEGLATIGYVSKDIVQIDGGCQGAETAVSPTDRHQVIRWYRHWLQAEPYSAR